MKETLLLSDSREDLISAAELIKSGELVGIPTETVYGLGADATDETAVRKIFRAKGRPSDNPLIVHLADFGDAVKYTGSIPDLAYKLAGEFCPGPLTIVLPKNKDIPYVTSGGLETVGIRIPSHRVMREIIRLSGCPIAAPSANRSGYPSPTLARHVMADMNGRIAAVVDGGECSIGLESTVVSIESCDTVRILRPGYITREDLRKICKNVIIDRAILSELKEGEKVSSPGMKYKHYSPEADVILIEASLEDFIEYVGKNNGDRVYSLIFDGDAKDFPYKFRTYGSDSPAQAHNIFRLLRELDEAGAEKIYVRAPSAEGIGLAVYNRLIRSAGFEVLRI